VVSEDIESCEARRDSWFINEGLMCTAINTPVLLGLNMTKHLDNSGE
jgi:hypothetical protein